MPSVAILGATGSIGSALARELVAGGRRVLLLGRDAGKVAALAGRLGQPGATVDLSGSAELEKTLRERSEELDGYDGLVNCVGSVLLKPAHLTSDDEFREVLETNLFSAFAAVRAGARVLRQGGGSIVLFASAAATVGLPNHEAIAAAKAGVAGLARAAAASGAAQGIRVNAIAPGLVKTELTRRIWDNPAAAEASRRMHALGRFGTPEQVASLAAWLLDPANDWITGQVIGLDGGLGTLQPRPPSTR